MKSRHGTVAPNLASQSEADIIREVCRSASNTAGDLTEVVTEQVRKLAPLHTPHGRHQLANEAIARLSGLGELDVFLHDPEVDEVMVNAGNEIWVDRAGQLRRAGSLSADRVEHLIERLLAPIGRRVDRSSPIVDARLPDGARVCAVLPPVAVDGATLCIRRFSEVIRPLNEFTDEAGEALCRQILDERCNLMVTGATSSGKTSLVASLLATLPDQERLVIVEDTTELPVSAAHAVRLEARPQVVDGPRPIDLAGLVRTALRLRPDRIVIGEVRGAEVLALVQAMNTGHDGSFSTCHANGAVDALLRLESLVLQAAPSWPLAAIKEQLTRSIDVIVHVERERAGRTRRIASISEVVAATSPGDTAGPTLRTLAELQDGDSLEACAELQRSRR